MNVYGTYDKTLGHFHVEYTSRDEVVGEVDEMEVLFHGMNLRAPRRGDKLWVWIDVIDPYALAPFATAPKADRPSANTQKGDQ